MIGGADVILGASRFEPCGLASFMVCATAHCRWFAAPADWRIPSPTVRSKTLLTGSRPDLCLPTARRNRYYMLSTGPVSCGRVHRCGGTLQRQAMNMDFSWQIAAKSFLPVVSAYYLIATDKKNGTTLKLYFTRSE